MSSMSPHWQVAASATHIYGSIAAAVTVTIIAISLILLCKLWKTQTKSRDKGILTPTQASTRSISELVPSQIHINQDASDEPNPYISILGQASITPRPQPVDHSAGDEADEGQLDILVPQEHLDKSTVAYTIASRAADLNLLGASFCFSRDEANRNNAKRFFTTIAYQLCAYNETFAKVIGDVLETEYEPAAIPQAQLQALILDPLRTIVQSRSRPILIVVDALEECDEEDAFSVFTGLSQLVCDLPSFKVILTTRPQLYLDAFLSRQNGHSIFHLQDIGDGDIRFYLKHCLSLDHVKMHFPKQQWCASDEEIGSLVRAAGRCFIITSTAVRYILDKTASNPAPQMQNLLHATAQDYMPFKDLDRLYTIILRDVVPEDCDDDGIVSRHQSVVGTIISIQRPLPVSTLAHLVGIGVEEIRAVLDKLQPVILLGDDDVPRIYHKSFPEYLTDQARCKDPRLRIGPVERARHTRIAIRCFEIMDKHLKHNILGLGDPARFMSNEDGLKEDGITDEQLEEKIPQQLRYACIYWVNHLEVGNIKDATLANGLQKFVDEHMLPYFEVLSLIGKLDLAHPAIDVVLKLLKSASSDLHRLLSDASRFIGKFYKLIKRSALHTYYSALPFTPTDTLLYRQYIKQVVHNICGIEGGPEKWDALVVNLNHGENIYDVKFSLDSTLLASGSKKYVGGGERWSAQGKLKIWNAATGIPISTIPGDNFVVANDFSTVASLRNNTITFYNVNGSARSTTFTTPSHIEKLAFSSESSRVAAALYDGTVWLWNSGNAELIDSFNGYESQLQFSPTGAKLAYSSRDGILLRDAISGEFIADLKCGSYTDFKFRFSGDGSRIASVSARLEYKRPFDTDDMDDSLAVWNAESGGRIAVVNHISNNNFSGLPGMAISTDGSLFAIDDRRKSEYAGNEVTLWSESRNHLDKIKVLESTYVHSTAFLWDNILAIATSWDIKLYDVKIKSFISTLPYSGMFPALAFSPDRTSLAVGNWRNVMVYDIRGVDAFSPPTEGNTSAVTALALSRNCSRLACGFKDGTVELWRTIPTKQLIASHQAHEGEVRALGFGPDSGLFASRSDDETVNLWNGEDGSLRGTLKVRRKCESVALSNSILAAAGDDRVTLWSLDTLSLIRTFSAKSRHGYQIPTVSIAENNALIAVAHSRGISLLDAENRRIITTFELEDWRGIYTMTFLPDNLITQFFDGVFLSFNLINKHVTKGATLEHLIQLPDIPLWHGVPVWYCRDKEHQYLAALFPQHKTPVPVLWIPNGISVTEWTQGSSMIALHQWENGRIILLRLPTRHVG